MNKREAMRIAHGIAYGLLQSALDAGIADIEDRSSKDGEKLEKALDSLAQRHFALSREGKHRDDVPCQTAEGAPQQENLKGGLRTQ